MQKKLFHLVRPRNFERGHLAVPPFFCTFVKSRCAENKYIIWQYKYFPTW